jgi:hypothetical protein
LRKNRFSRTQFPRREPRAETVSESLWESKRRGTLLIHSPTWK